MNQDLRGGGEEEAERQGSILRDVSLSPFPLCRKKAMEAELLRSKTEMMSLNNQLLEAVQKRLELSLELEAWKVNLRRV